MEQDAPLDEIALVIIACMFHFHTCILSETKFWTTNREHKIGMCLDNNASDPHNTSMDSCTSLTEKLAGISDADKIAEVIKCHAESMPRPSPPLPKDTTPIPTLPSSPKKTFVFIQLGIKCQCKPVQKFNCVLCDDTFGTQKELNEHIKSAHTGFKFTCRYCRRQYESANGCFKHERSHEGYD